MTQSPQFSTFKDCLARRVLAHPGILDHTSPSEPQDGPDALALDDFTTYLAEEIWPYIPPALQDATYETRDADAVPDVDDLPLSNIPPTFTDTLLSCGLAHEADDATMFLRKVLKNYLAEASGERAVPLTYHHLIPRSAHDKARKKKWHPETMLNSVAWLCRPCHSAVHGVARNEVLAREFYTVELLLARDDIQRWRKYAAKQRFGVHRG